MRIAVIGGGVMGEAFLRCFIKAQVVSSGAVCIVDCDEAKRKRLQREYGCQVMEVPDSRVGGADVIVLAVKPQDMQAACVQIQPVARENALFLSVMAGVSLSSISEALAGRTRIVRCMPNLPVQVGLGMTVYMTYAGLPTLACKMTEDLLLTTGKCLRVTDERLIDAATAVAGSGPGYLFYLIEFMTFAAQQLGFSEQEAELLVSQTIAGSLQQWQNSSLKARDLCSQVTSKGGTTEAALQVFHEGKLGDTFVAAIKRAYERAVELGVEASKR